MTSNDQKFFFEVKNKRSNLLETDLSRLGFNYLGLNCLHD